jgi:hypothetical protein
MANRRAPRAPLLALVALAAVARPAGAVEGLQAAAELQYSHYDQGARESDSLGERLRLGYDRNVSAPLSYGLKLAWLNDQANVFTDGPSPLQQTLLAGLRLGYAQPAVGSTLLYELSRMDVQGVSGLPGAATTAQRGLTTLSFSPQGSAFAGGAMLEWQGQSATAAATTNQYRGSLSGSYTAPRGGAQLGTGLELFDNLGTGYRRWTVSPNAGGNLSASFLDGAVSLNSSVTATYSHYEESLRSGSAVSEPREVAAQGAGFVVTSLPTDTSTTPASPAPALLDGDLAASAGISLGPDGSSFSNLSLDIGRIVTLDQLRIYVRDPAGSQLQAGGPVSWSIYTSVDGRYWLPCSLVASVFDVSLSAWELTFQPTAARYFKAVNFGVNLLPTLVTELKSFEHRLFLPNQVRTSSQAAEVWSMGLSVVPVEKLSVSLSANVGATQQLPDQAPDTFASTRSVAASASAGPYGGVTVGAGASRLDVVQSGVPLLRSSSLNASVQYVPVPILSLGVEGALAEQVYGDLRIGSRSASASGSLRPLTALTLGVYGGLAQSESATTQQTVGSAGASLTSRLRRDLELLLSASYQKRLSGSEVVPEGVPIPRQFLISSYSAGVNYRPSLQLDIRATFGYTEAERASGLVQNYRVFWRPFVAGSVSLSSSYQQDVDPLGGSRQHRASLSAQWTPSKFLTLSGTYFRQWGSGTLSIPIENFMLTLSGHL